MSSGENFGVNFIMEKNRPEMEYCSVHEKYSDPTFGNDADHSTDLDEFTPPEDDIIEKMVSQIEYYLSDDNLAKDAFLLKHLRRSRMGYVNIKLLTSLRKMRQLTKDWRMTAYALRQSQKLELNQEGTKVRRKVPIPKSLMAPAPSKLLLLWNLPQLSLRRIRTDPPRSILESAITILSPFGTISTIRAVRPGRELPQEIRKYASRYPELCSQDCVLVEYEDGEGAGHAYRELSQAAGAIRVLLVQRTSKKMAGLSPGNTEVRHANKAVDTLSQSMARLQYGGNDSSGCSSSESSLSQACGGVLQGETVTPNPRCTHTALPCSPVHPLLDSSPETCCHNHSYCPAQVCSSQLDRHKQPVLHPLPSCD